MNIMNNPFLVQAESKQKFIDLFELQNMKSKEIKTQCFIDEFDIRIPTLVNGKIKFVYTDFIHDILDAENTLFFFEGFSEISIHTQQVILESLLENYEHSNIICFLIKDFNNLGIESAIANKLIIINE